MLGFEHIFPMSSTLILPVLIAAAGNAGHEASQSFLRLSMVAGGVATIIMALRLRWLGSGYLCPNLCGPAYYSASLMAAHAGGLALVCGMTVFTGVFKCVLAPLARRLRFLFPSEVTGLVVAMVGVSLIGPGTQEFYGLAPRRPILAHRTARRAGFAADEAPKAPGPAAAPEGRPALRWPTILASVLSLGAMVALTVWGSGIFKLYSLLIGMVFGYLVCYVLTRTTGVALLTNADVARVGAQEWIALPKFGFAGLAFKASLALPFAIAAVGSYLKTVGNLSTCQKANDKDWKRLDMRTISGGLMANGLGTLLSGLLGGMSQSTSSSNVGLSVATGATSRVIAFAAGGIFIALAFIPKLAELVLIMPAPVKGAMVVYVACYMILAGLQIITSRMLDARRIFIVGTAMVFGLGVEINQEIHAAVPLLLQPIFESSLSTATVLVIVLNLLLRIGIAKRRTLTVEADPRNASKVVEFMEAAGGAWGARREVVSRATAAMADFLENAPLLDLRSPEVRMDARFDEFNLDVTIRYAGCPMEFPERRPTKQEMIEREDAAQRLAGYVISHAADRVESQAEGDEQVLRLHFDH